MGTTVFLFQMTLIMACQSRVNCMEMNNCPKIKCLNAKKLRFGLFTNEIEYMSKLIILFLLIHQILNILYIS